MYNPCIYLNVVLLLVLRRLPLNHLLLVLVLLLSLPAARAVLPARVRAEHEPGGDSVPEGQVAVLQTIRKFTRVGSHLTRVVI